MSSKEGMMIVLLLLTLTITTALPTGEALFITTASPTGDDLNLTLPTEVTKDVLDSLKTAEKIDIFTALIIQQASFPKFSEVENLTDHQQAAKETALMWRLHVRSKLFSVNDAILAFSNEFDAFYDSLVEYADKLGTEEGKHAFVFLLEELSTSIRQQHNDSISAGQTLTEFLHRMMQHEGVIKGDRDRIILTSKKSETQVQDIRRRIDAIDQAIRKKEKELESPIGHLPHIFLFPIIGILVPWTEWRNDATNALHQKLQEKKHLIIELDNISSRIALADFIARDVVTLVSHIQNVVNATEELNNAWSQLERDYNTVKISVERLTATAKAKLVIAVKNRLAAAKSQWQTLAESAKVIKNKHLIPQRRY